MHGVEKNTNQAVPAPFASTKPATVKHGWICVVKPSCPRILLRHQSVLTLMSSAIKHANPSQNTHQLT